MSSLGPRVDHHGGNRVAKLWGLLAEPVAHAASGAARC